MKILREYATVVDVDDPKNKHRVRVGFHKSYIFTTDEIDVPMSSKESDYNMVSGWLINYSSSQAGGKQGIATKLKVGDLVVISYIDYPNNQQPFVEFKNDTNDEDIITVDDETRVMYNDHYIDFNSGNITISNEDENLQIIIDGGGKIQIKNKGNELISLFSDTLDNLINAKVITAIGAMPFDPATIVKLTELKNKIDTFK